MKYLYFLVALMAVAIASPIGESEELGKRLYRAIRGGDLRPAFGSSVLRGYLPLETAGRSAGGKRALSARYIPVGYSSQAASSPSGPRLAYAIPQAGGQEQAGYRY